LDIPRNDWDHVLKVLKTCVGAATFSQWFAPIRFVSAQDAEIRVVLPSAEFRDELLEHHENMINYGKSCAGLHMKRLIYLTPQELAALSNLSTPLDLHDPAHLL
jgi:chromosomal replication initiation ATPase DnaA